MTSPFEAERRRIAALIERDNPRWMVVWGVYSRVFWAYPKFDLPQRMILHHEDPNQLVAYMRQVEQQYVGQPAPQHHEIKDALPGEIEAVDKPPDGEPTEFG
jgi:hypothetical protein